MSVLTKEYILYDEDKSVALDKEAFQRFLDKEATDEIKQDYDNLNMFNSLQAWWEANYDPKGLAFDHSYHASILHDFDKMIKRYLEYKPFLKDSFKFYADLNNNTVLIHLKNFAVENEQDDEFEELEYFSEDLLYFYKGVDISNVDLDLDNENTATITCYFNDNVLSYEY